METPLIEFFHEGAHGCCSRVTPARRDEGCTARPSEELAPDAPLGLGVDCTYPDHSGWGRRAVGGRQLGASPRIAPGRVGDLRRCDRHGEAALVRTPVLLPARPRGNATQQPRLLGLLLSLPRSEEHTSELQSRQYL